jgi:hypothetical protein
MINFFLAIKFKVRFRYRFCKKYGQVYEERQQKTAMRHLTLLAPCFYENRCEKAKMIIAETLKRYNYIRELKRNARNAME